MDNQPLDAPTVVLVSTRTIEENLDRIREAIPALTELRESLCPSDPRHSVVTATLNAARTSEEWLSEAIQ